MGTFVGLAARELDILYWAGLLHDVGKIAVPEAILQKPGRLDESEWTLMRDHPGLGARLIAGSSPDLAPIAVVVAAHHECWDGSGYPDGLAGEAIPRLARIISIVDVFEALTCARPYRDALDPGAALAYITENSGIKFDPDLVPVFEQALAQQAIVVADPTAVSTGSTDPAAMAANCDP